MSLPWKNVAADEVCERLTSVDRSARERSSISVSGWRDQAYRPSGSEYYVNFGSDIANDALARSTPVR